MRILAAVGDNIHSVHPDVNAFSVPIKGTKIQFALLSTPHTESGLIDSLDDQAVLLRIEAFSCNFRDQALLISRYRQDPDNLLWPFGSEFCAKVIAVGKHVDDLTVGDRVMGDNAYHGQIYVNALNTGVVTNNASMEYMILPSDRLVKVPTNMTPFQAAAFSLSAQTAYSMVRRSGCTKGQKILVMSGSSSTSLAIIGALNAVGVRPFVATTSQRSSEISARYMTEAVIDSTDIEMSIFKYAKELGGFHIVLDPFIDLNAKICLLALRPNGRYITCGLADQFDGQDDSKLINFTNFISKAISNNIEVVFNCLGTRNDLETAIQDYSQGKYLPDIDRLFRIGEEREFIEYSFENRGKFGKVVYSFSNLEDSKHAEI